MFINLILGMDCNEDLRLLDKLFVACRIIRSAVCPLVQPVKTRWGTCLNMFQSLLKHRKHLEQAIAQSEFARLAKSARSGLDSVEDELEADEHIDEMATLLAGEEVSTSNDMPIDVANNRRYARVYKIVRDASFWKGAQQYVDLNEPVASAITSLSGDSVCLSDAVYLVMTAGKSIGSATFSQFSSLFDSEHQVAELKDKWNVRANHLTGFAHLALLLDPRPHFRDFVKGEKIIIGSHEGKDYGNTAFLNSADECLRGMADMVLADSHKTVRDRSSQAPYMSLLDSKQALLSGALKAFIGMHEKKRLKHLNIDENKLKQHGVDGGTPLSFWQHDVPTQCLLREAAIRVMSAKPSSTAVERLWNAFGDNLTAKRRSMKNKTLRSLCM
jgi:hypothetical protein